MPLVLDLFCIHFLGNTFRFYTVYTYSTRNEIFILLLESEVFISPKRNKRCQVFSTSGEDASSATRCSKSAVQLGTEGLFKHCSVLWLHIQPQTLLFPALPIGQILVVNAPAGTLAGLFL